MMNNYLFRHNDWNYIVQEETLPKAKYGLFEVARGTGFQGTFKEFLTEEIEYKGKLTDEEAQELVDKEEAEWA